MMFYMDHDEMEWAVMTGSNTQPGMDPLMIGDVPLLFGAMPGPAWTCQQYLPAERTVFYMDTIDAEHCPVMESARRIAERVKACAMTGALVASIDVEMLDDKWLVAVQWRAGMIHRI